MIYPISGLDAYDKLHAALAEHGRSTYVHVVTGHNVVVGRLVWLNVHEACIGDLKARTDDMLAFDISSETPALLRADAFSAELTRTARRVGVADRARSESRNLGMSPAEAGAYIEDAINAADAAALEAERPEDEPPPAARSVADDGAPR